MSLSRSSSSTATITICPPIPAVVVATARPAVPSVTISNDASARILLAPNRLAYASLEELIALPAGPVIDWALAGLSRPPHLPYIEHDLAIRVFAACVRFLALCHSHWNVVAWRDIVPFCTMDLDATDVPEVLYRRAHAALRWRVRSVGVGAASSAHHLHPSSPHPLHPHPHPSGPPCAIDAYLASLGEKRGEVELLLDGGSPLPLGFWRAIGRDMLAVAVDGSEPLLLYIDKAVLQRYPGTQGVDDWYMEDDITCDDHTDSDGETYELDDIGYRELQCEACEGFNVPLRYFGRYYTPDELRRHTERIHSPVVEAHRWINSLNHSYKSGGVWCANKYKCPAQRCPIWYKTRTQLVFHLLLAHAEIGDTRNLPTAHMLTFAESMAKQNNMYGETARKAIPALQSRMMADEKERDDDDRVWRRSYPLGYT